MRFFIHENFPDPAGDLLRAFDGARHEFEKFSDAYPPGTPDAEWISCIGKQANKPVVLRLGGISTKNKVMRKALAEASCIFVCFSAGWMKGMLWEELAWRLLKYWPEIVKTVEGLKGLAIIEVSTNGKMTRTPL